MAKLSALFASSRERADSDGTLLGIGDDAAVLAPGLEPLIWSVDTQVAGVHFRGVWLTPEELGYRATMSAASDLAAMGATPRGVLASLIIPADGEPSDSWPASDHGALVLAIARGQREACDRLGTHVIGGNLSRGGELSVTTTVLGSAARPLRRDGARAGDVVYLAGAAGLAKAGLLALEAQREDETALAAAVHAWRRPEARMREGALAAGFASSAIDVSDGLACDARRLAVASGVSLILEEERLIGDTAHALVRDAAASLLGCSRLALALMGGEDYALLVTARADAVPGSGFVRIGYIEEAQEPGAFLASAAGKSALSPDGFDHFRSANTGIS
ncbi:MAG: thiamine-phosphate kinase [Myxococcales bacterium]|nr:thiamine-phosphate kinase [Myxococcales bacterium]